MALQHEKLADIAYVGASAGSIYTNPSSTKTFLKGLILFNGNTAAETIKVYVVPDSAGSLGTAGAANQIAEVSLAAKSTLYLPTNIDGMPLVLTDTNDSIQAATTTASKVTVIPVGDME